MTIRKILLSLLLCVSPFACAEAGDGKYGYLDKNKVDELLVQLRRGVETDNPVLIAPLIGFPLDCTIDGVASQIRSAPEFLSQYRALFNPAIRKLILNKNSMTWNWSGVKLGRGELWIRGKKNEPKIAYINTDINKSVAARRLSLGNDTHSK